MNAPMVRVGDISEQIRGVTYAKGDASPSPAPDLVPLLRAGNIEDTGLHYHDLVYVPATKVAPKQMVQRGDVLIAASSGSIDIVGKAAQAGEGFRGGFGAFCKVLRPGKLVDARYFGHFFRTEPYRRTISSLAAGANINNLRNEHLDDLAIRLPSMAEQRRIAEVLGRVDALRAQRRRAIALLDYLAQSIFIEMFGDLTFEHSRWENGTLSDLVVEFRYGTSQKSGSDGFPTLRIPNVMGGVLDVSDLKLVPVSGTELGRLRLLDGDVLFVRTNGNPDYVGRCAIFTRDSVAAAGRPTGDFIYASYLIRARLRTDLVEPVFVRQFMLGRAGRRALRDRCKTSAGQYNINIQGLGGVRMAMPPVALQREFRSKITTIEHLKDQHIVHLAELDELFAALQYRAFRGEPWEDTAN